MAITRAQQFKQMLREGGRIGFKGGADAATQSFAESLGGGGQKGKDYAASVGARPDSTFRGGDDRGGGPTFDRIEDDGGELVVVRTPPSTIDKDRAKKLSKKFRRDRGIQTLNRLYTQGVKQVPPFPGSSVLNLLTPFRNFTLRKNIDYFKERPKAIERYGLSAEGYKDYIKDRLAGKIDAAGNIAPGFMEGPGGEIISTGNDGRQDPIIPAMVEAMEEEDAKEEYVNPLSLLTPRIAGSRFLGSEFAADGGRIGYDDGGMLVSPSKDGKRPGYRSAKAQESKKQSREKYQASTTQQQRRDDREDFQEQRQRARQQLKKVKPGRIDTGFLEAFRKSNAAKKERYFNILNKYKPEDFRAQNLIKGTTNLTEEEQEFMSQFPMGQIFRDLSELSTDNLIDIRQGKPEKINPMDLSSPLEFDFAGGIATPNIATGNIVYDERLGLIDARTGEPVNTAMPGAKFITSEAEKDILRATGQLKDQKQKILDATGIGSGAEVGPVPDLTDPKVAGGIAEAGGLTTGLKTVGQKKLPFTDTPIPGTGEQIRVPSDLSQQAIEEIQRDKRQLGLTREQVIDKAKEFDYPTSITEEGAGTIYDMVQADQLPRTLAAEGGIMDLGRQELFLGGIAKGLKKAAKGISRTLRKVAKSPVGKAALLGALGYGLGGGTFFGKMLPGVTRGGQGIGGFGGLDAIFGNVGDMIGGKTLGDAFAKFGGSKLGLGATLVSILPLLAGKTEEEKKNILDEYLASQKLNPSLSVRGTGSELDFDFYGARTQRVADGGRIGYQEGSKEPVAKKTMPLLDMDGQEMDLRDNGGFVPIGRMEKADDVPARLSKNEFVFTADAVRNAGDGDVDKGAEVMYNMMKNLERGGNVSDESQGLEGAREMFQTSKRLEEVL